MEKSSKIVKKTIDLMFEDIETIFNTVNVSAVSNKDQIRLQTRFQTLFGLRFQDPNSSLIHQTIMTHALQAEKLGTNGFDDCIQNLLALWREETTVDALKDTLSDIQNSGTRSATVGDLNNLTLKLSPKLREMLLVAFDLCGFGGRIFVEKALGKEPSVELITGFTYALKPVFPVQTQLFEVKIACIDGFIESVSEIHGLLTTLFESKSTALLFVRGLHDEVKQTLKVNHDRGTLKVYPFIVPFDLEGINTLVDLATLANGDVTSSTKGDLISLLKASDLPTIEKATIFNDRVVLINKTSRNRVKTHIDQLKLKRESYNDESLTRLIDLRIRALSPNQVMIRLPDNESFAVDAQLIDRTLRTLRSMVEHGMLGDTPAASRAAGVIHAIRCWETLQSLAVFVTV